MLQFCKVHYFEYFPCVQAKIEQRPRDILSLEVLDVFTLCRIHNLFDLKASTLKSTVCQKGLWINPNWYEGRYFYLLSSISKGLELKKLSPRDKRLHCCMKTFDPLFLFFLSEI